MRARWCRSVLACAVVTLTLGGCLDVSHHCADSTQCLRGDVAGVCGPDGQCSFPDDDSGVADAARADAAGDASAIDTPLNDASVDDDGDGVVNASDNCRAVANPDQHDEDTDTVGDVCDGCPHLADPLQVNGDGDGLGDACDPRPGNPINQQVLFEPFSGTTFGAWTAHAGSWSQSGDAMRVIGNATIARVHRPITVPAGRGLIVETRVTIVAIDPAPGLVYAGLAGPVDFAAGAGNGCAIFDNTSTALEMEAMSVEVAATTLSFNRIGGFADPISPLTASITHTRTGSARCDVAIGSDTKGGGYNNATALPLTRIGLLSRNVTASYAYVFAYTD